MHWNYTLKPALSARRHKEPCPRMTDSPFRLPPNFKFWLVIVALALTALIVFSEILLPFAAGFVLAYLFHPFVSALNRIGVPRGAGALVVIMVLALFVALMIALILPPLLDELGQLIEKTPAYYQDARAFLLKHYTAYLQRLGYSPSQGPQEAQRQIAQDLAPWVLAQAKSVLQGGLALFNSLALAFLTPVVTFFLLRDWTQMIAAVEKVLPRRDAPTIKAIARDIDWTISGYMRGTLIVLVIVSGFYMAALGIIGLNYGLIIGLGRGLSALSPISARRSAFSCRAASGRPILARLCDDCDCLRRVRSRPGGRGQCADAEYRRRQGAAASGVAVVLLGRVRLSARLYGLVDFGAGGRGDRRAGAFRHPRVLSKRNVRKREEA